MENPFWRGSGRILTAIALLSLYPTGASCGDWPAIPAGERVLQLDYTPARFAIRQFTLPPGIYHFIFSPTAGATGSKGDGPELILSRKTGSSTIRTNAWGRPGMGPGAALRPGEYDIAFANAAFSRAKLHLVIDAGRSSYPVVIITESRRTLQISPRRVAPGTVCLRFAHPTISEADYGLYRTNWPPILLLTTLKGRPVEVYLKLAQGAYRFHDIRMGLESPQLTCENAQGRSHSASGRVRRPAFLKAATQ